MWRLGAILLSIFCIIFQGCVPIHSLFLINPSHKDATRFANKEIIPPEKCFQFKKVDENKKMTIMVTDRTTRLPVFSSIQQVVESHSTSAFLVIRNDTILYEYYDKDYNEFAHHSSYSVAKSFVSALVGIAIDEGKIKSEKELASTYLPDITGHPYYKKVTLEHLMNHTSGISNKLTVDAYLYYGHNLLKSMKQIDFDNEPGKVQSYVNMNTQLVGMILEKATGKSPSQYLEEKLWKPLGMCSSAFWSTDRKNKIEKSFCCISATAQDYARFGRLYLNEGNWNGKQIISKSWYDKSTKRDTSEGSSYTYSLCWHMGFEEYGDFLADGLYKQFIYIQPKKNLLIILLSERENMFKSTRVRWRHVFRQISDQL